MGVDQRHRRLRRLLHFQQSHARRVRHLVTLDPAERLDPPVRTEDSAQVSLRCVNRDVRNVEHGHRLARVPHDARVRVMSVPLLILVELLGSAVSIRGLDGDLAHLAKIEMQALPVELGTLEMLQGQRCEEWLSVLDQTTVRLVLHDLDTRNQPVEAE